MRKTNRKKIIIILNVTENFKLLKKKKDTHVSKWAKGMRRQERKEEIEVLEKQ